MTFDELERIEDEHFAILTSRLFCTDHALWQRRVNEKWDAYVNARKTFDEIHPEYRLLYVRGNCPPIVFE